MPLTKASLSTKLQTELQGIFGTADDAVQLKKVTDAIAKAVVDEIQQNGTATGTCAVSGGSSAGSHPVTIPAGGID